MSICVIKPNLDDDDDDDDNDDNVFLNKLQHRGRTKHSPVTETIKI
jgi:hypothetical protein